MHRKFGPMTEQTVTGHKESNRKCPACDQEFKVGDFTTLVTLGPGDSEESQQRAVKGRPYNAVALEVHWACATGEV
jgi:hypothetical protein